jgi:hypothetical protein
MSTSAVDMWRAVKIWSKNPTNVPNEFLFLIQVPLIIQNKTKVLNLKTLKTQVPMRSIFKSFLKSFKIDYNRESKKPKRLK